jgi:hypothetical protein
MVEAEIADDRREAGDKRAERVPATAADRTAARLLDERLERFERFRVGAIVGTRRAGGRYKTHR